MHPSVIWPVRPVLQGGQGCVAGGMLDAGVCHEDSVHGISCLPSFIIIGAMKAGTAELQVRRLECD